MCYDADLIVRSCCYSSGDGYGIYFKFIYTLVVRYPLATLEIIILLELDSD